MLDNPKTTADDIQYVISHLCVTSTQKRLSSDEALERLYKSLRDQYLKLQFDPILVKKQEYYYKILAQGCRIFAKLKGIKILHKERIADNKPLIFTSNHIGSYDQFFIPALLGTTPIHYLVKKKVTTWPVRWNLLYKPTGAIVVDLDSMSSWKQAKARIAQYVLYGKRVFIFAEGSRRGEKNIGEFSAGVSQIAQETGAEVGTLAIKNCASLRSRNPIICMGDTLSVGPRENLKLATERIRQCVINAYNDILAYEEGITKK